MKQRFLPVLSASLLLGLVFNFLFYNHGIGLNAFLFTAVFIGLTGALLLREHQLPSLSVSSLCLIALLFSTGPVLRANGFLQFLDVVAVLYILTVVALLVWRPATHIADFTGHDYLRRTLRLPFLAMVRFLQLVPRSFSFNIQATTLTKRRLLPAVRGVLISLPVLLIFILLFSSADPVFKHYITSLFSFQISPDLIGHLLVIAKIASFFVGLYAIILSRSGELDWERGPGRVPKLGSIEATILLGSVVTLFLLFVLIQLSYLFGGQSNVTVPGGLSYAAYARKGFGELMVAATIVFLLLLELHRLVIRRTVQQQLVFRLLCVALTLEVGLVMLSALRRLSLLEQAYGFTVLRLYSHMFIFWLAVALVLLLIYIVRNVPRNVFAGLLALSLLIFLGVINVVNPDAFVARQNIQRYQATGKIDTGYLYVLSADATPVLADLLDTPDKKVQDQMAYNLYYQQLNLSRQDASWLAHNLSKSRAQQLLDAHYDQLETHKNPIN